ncbi:hypothetical protein OIU91_20435 [Streptomyces sp. NBC_01456]|uniref:hypothetical protein n=1 Tax=unclassified Streptomyces TaxID=2593676 RepID=UPI002E370F1B|nr:MULTISPECIES: hypothetical protein [unclassified Streptomyces]
MTERNEGEQQAAAAALRKGHAARAESAAARAAALSRYVEQHASDGHADAVWKAAHAARVAAQALAVFAENSADAAAESRCARNAAAAAAQASQMGQLVAADTDHAGAALELALKAAFKASQAAGAAAGAPYGGAREELNAAADVAEADAVSAATQAGWIRPGESVPSVDIGVRSSEVLSMLHF